MRRWVLGVVLLSLSPAAVGAARNRSEVGTRGGLSRLAASRPGSVIETSNHICAVRDDGIVLCWGANSRGELGNGTTSNNQPAPVQVANVNNIKSVAAGAQHSCELVGGGGGGGTVFCWGYGFYGQLGNGLTKDSSIPVQVKNLFNVVEIAAGDYFTCALRVDGSVWCWGQGAADVIGLGTSNSATPVQASVANAVALTAASGHACALQASGTVACWGDSFYGLGDGVSTRSRSAVQVTGISNAVALLAGYFDTCVLIADGTLRCWGYNGNYELGDGTNQPRHTPVTPPINNVVAVSTSGNHTCAVKATGQVYCWGTNQHGELGDATATGRQIPATSINGLTDIVDIALAQHSSCAINVFGSVRCWGADELGQLGNGTINTGSNPAPANVTGISGSVGAVGMITVPQTNCARRGNGSVWCWGEGSNGTLGNGHIFPDAADDSANAVSTGIANAVTLGGGGRHVCAVLSNGNLSCWGQNNFGQLGDGGTTDQPSPVAVNGLSNVIAVTGGQYHTCALLADGTVRCWGANFEGELGSPAASPTFTPTAVTGLTGAKAVAAGDFHACAVLADGTARCWGDNSDGQLGDNKNELMSNVPVQPFASDLIGIAGGDRRRALLLRMERWDAGEKTTVANWEMEARRRARSRLR